MDSSKARKKSGLSTAQIGKCGETLVQYWLLKFGVESAPMTTDNGIDLVAYAPITQRAVTIQVKANEKAKRAGGKGALALDWWLREDSPAEIIALVDLETDQIWLFTHLELEGLAQQHSNGKMHFYFYIDETYHPKNSNSHMRNFGEYEIRKRAGKLLR